MQTAKLGIAPIAWWNDDLSDLSDDVSLEECLRQASLAGFSGMETGRRFPMDMAELGPILDRFGLRATLVDRALLNVPPAAVYRLTRRPRYRLLTHDAAPAADTDVPPVAKDQRAGEDCVAPA